MAILLNPRVWIAFALAAVLAFTHIFVYRAGKANVRADFDAYKAAQMQLMQKAEQESRAKEQAWQDQVNQIGATKDEQIRAIGSKLSTALASLSNRPSRPPGAMPQAPSTCPGSTGAGLYRQDGQFLAGEAAAAASIAAERDYCYAAYNRLQPSSK